MSPNDSVDTLFDPLAPGFADSPYEQYAQLRDRDPVHRSELLQGWVVTRFSDVGKLLRDPTVSSDIHHATPNPLTVMELELLSEQPRASQTVVLMDDPDHARVRALMTDPFRPREIEALRARITERVDAAFDRLRDRYGATRAEFDLISEFAYPLPVEIFSEMLGMPEEDSPQFRYWAQCVARMVDPVMSAAERAECTRGLDDMHACLGSHLARIQAEIAFGAIFDRLDGIEPAAVPEWGTRMFIRSLNSLPCAPRSNPVRPDRFAFLHRPAPAGKCDRCQPMGSGLTAISSSSTIVIPSYARQTWSSRPGHLARASSNSSSSSGSV